MKESDGGRSVRSQVSVGRAALFTMIGLALALADTRPAT